MARSCSGIRTLNDKNLWVADFPYQVVNGNPQPYPGFNQLNNTYNSKQLQNFLIPSPSGGFENDDISNGRGAQLQLFRFRSQGEFRQRLVHQQ